MKKRFAVHVVLSLLFVHLVLYAQETVPEVTGESSALTPYLYRFSEIPGTPLYIGRWLDSTRNELADAGKISDLVITRSGVIALILADLSAVEGIEAGTYLLSPEILALGNNETIVLELGTPRVELMRVNDERLIRQFFPEGSVQATRLISFPVSDAEDRRIGKVHELVIDIMSGEVAYVALGPGGFLGIGRKQVAVSFHDLSIDAGGELVRLDFTRRQFDSMTGFEDDLWPLSAERIPDPERN